MSPSFGQALWLATRFKFKLHYRLQEISESCMLLQLSSLMAWVRVVSKHQDLVGIKEKMNPYPVHEITLDIISKYMREGLGLVVPRQETDHQPIAGQEPQSLNPSRETVGRRQNHKGIRPIKGQMLMDPPRDAPSLCLLSHAHRPFGFEFFSFYSEDRIMEILLHSFP